MMKPDRPFKSKGSPYPQEFREEAVRYWLSSGQPLKTVAADLGVSPECLRSWRSQMESPAAQAQITNSTSESAPATTAKELTLAREIGELRRELEAMTRQRDILKRLSASSRKTKASTEVRSDRRDDPILYLQK
jgi:transposase